jgi:RND superfamily putative drug exporter
MVLAGWCLALLAAILIRRIVPATYWANYQTPGAEATRTFDLLDERFSDRKGDSIFIVFSAAGGIAEPTSRSTITALLASLADFPHVASVNSPFASGGSIQIAPDGKTAFAVVNLDRTIDKLANLDSAYQKKFLDFVRPGRRDGLQIEVTTFVSSMSLGNETIALGFATLVLLVAFGSLLATGLPILTALFGLGIGAALGGCLTHVVETPDWAVTVATMIGLGVGVDYALFIVTRYRRALSLGLDPERAVRIAMATAGWAVLFAGSTVVFSLLGMATMGLGYVNGVLTASVVAVVVILAASLTLLPALLGFVGKNMDRLRVPLLGRPDSDDRTNIWYRWSRLVQRRPWVAFAVGSIALALLSLPIFSLRFGLPDDGNRPMSETSRRAYDLLTTAFGPGFNGPLLVLVDSHGTELSNLVLDDITEEIRSLAGVAFVAPAIRNPAGNAALFCVYPTSSPQSQSTEQLVHQLRHEAIPRVLEGTGMTAVVGGFTAISIDQARYVLSRLPWFIGAVVFISFLLLTVVFRSPVVALKAGVMNLLSIAAAYGVMAYAVNGTWLGHLLHIPKTPVPAFVPLITFAVLFGMSMDYEVFLLSRIREEYKKSGNNSTAVADGLAGTARVITAAAAIMVFVFGVFMFDPNVFIKQIGLGLTSAVLVDATVVRILLVPAAMELLGKANWWLPRWLDRILPDLHVHATDEAP